MMPRNYLSSNAKEKRVKAEEVFSLEKWIYKNGRHFFMPSDSDRALAKEHLEQGKKFLYGEGMESPRYDQAFLSFKQALLLDRENAEIWDFLGCCLRDGLGTEPNWQEMHYAFELAVRLNPTCQIYWNNLGQSYVDGWKIVLKCDFKPDYERAAECFRKAGETYRADWCLSMCSASTNSSAASSPSAEFSPSAESSASAASAALAASFSSAASSASSMGCNSQSTYLPLSVTRLAKKVRFEDEKTSSQESLLPMFALAEAAMAQDMEDQARAHPPSNVEAACAAEAKPSKRLPA